MALLVTLIAAVVSTLLWYLLDSAQSLRLGVLCFLYWGASLMWMVDAVFEYVKLQAAFFNPAPVDLLNDLYLGLSVTVLGAVVWLVLLLVRDPKGKLRAALRKDL